MNTATEKTYGQIAYEMQWKEPVWNDLDSFRKDRWQLSADVVISEYQRRQGGTEKMRETLEWIAGQQDLFFAECSQAEEIIERVRAALSPNAATIPRPDDNSRVVEDAVINHGTWRLLEKALELMQEWRRIFIQECNLPDWTWTLNNQTDELLGQIGLSAPPDEQGKGQQFQPQDERATPKGDVPSKDRHSCSASQSTSNKRDMGSPAVDSPPQPEGGAIAGGPKDVLGPVVKEEPAHSDEAGLHPRALPPDSKKPKSSSTPAFVAALYPIMVNAAKAVGYSLSVHGSLVRDFDLIAVPWHEGAGDAAMVAMCIAESIGGSIPPRIDLDGKNIVDNPQKKPHGRIGWTIRFGNGEQYIDLSVTPRLEVSSTPSPPVQEGAASQGGAIVTIEGKPQLKAAETLEEAESNIDQVMLGTRFHAGHPFMLDWARIKFALKELTQVRYELTEEKKYRRTIQQELTAASDERDGWRTNWMKLNKELEQAKREVERLTRESQEQESEMCKRLNDECNALTARLAERTVEVNELRAEETNLIRQRDSLRAELEKSNTALSSHLIELGEAYAELSRLKQSQSPWISVKERIATTEESPTGMAYFCNATGFKHIWHSAYDNIKGATHWMPIPPLPVESEPAVDGFEEWWRDELWTTEGSELKDCARMAWIAARKTS